MRNDHLQYLSSHGLHFKSAESPDLWMFLEDHFTALRHIGPKFVPMAGARITEVIARGEEALLAAMVEHHCRIGKVKTVSVTIEMPYMVGTSCFVAADRTGPPHLLHLIDRPGSSHEKLIHVLPTKADIIPGTHHLTVTGGLYADGHTAGFYDLHPGETIMPGMDMPVMLATPDEIAMAAHDMEDHAEEIAVASRHDCEMMVWNARQALKH